MKTGYIVLSGGGDLEISFKTDEKYLSLLKNNSKILYLPIALKRNRVGFEACYDWFSTVVSSHAKDNDFDFTMLLEEDPIPDLTLFDSIFMGGGNTYKLLNYLKTKEMGNKIIDFLKNGGVVYGGSAGAIVLGKDIRTVEEENDNNYSHYQGLDLLQRRSVICHYSESLDEGIFKSVRKTNSEVFALPEDSGMLLDSNGKILETVGKVFIFDKDKKTEI